MQRGSYPLDMDDRWWIVVAGHTVEFTGSGQGSSSSKPGLARSVVSGQLIVRRWPLLQRTPRTPRCWLMCLATRCGITSGSSDRTEVPFMPGRSLAPRGNSHLQLDGANVWRHLLQD